MEISSSSYISYPLALASVVDSWQNQLLLWWLQNHDFLTPSFLLHILVGLLLKRIFPLSACFNLFIYLYLYGLRVLLFPWVFYCYNYWLWCSNHSRFGQWVPLEAVSYFLSTHHHHFLGASPYFLTENILGSFCIFSASTLNQLFLQRAVAQQDEKWYLKTKIWVLDLFVGTGMSYLVDPVSRQREGIYIYIFLCILRTMNSNWCLSF